MLTLSDDPTVKGMEYGHWSVMVCNGGIETWFRVHRDFGHNKERLSCTQLPQGFGLCSYKCQIFWTNSLSATEAQNGNGSNNPADNDKLLLSSISFFTRSSGVDNIEVYCTTG